MVRYNTLQMDTEDRLISEQAFSAHSSLDPGLDSGENSTPDVVELVQRIQADDTTALEDLYRIFARGIKYQICRQLGPQDLEDKVHDCFLIVVQAIRHGELREPDRLMGFVRTVVRRQIAAYIETVIQTRKQMTDLETGRIVADFGQNPENSLLDHEEEELAYRVLKGISRRDREILIRFYLNEEPQDLICEKMNLTDTQFRLLKSRAKARFGELGKRRLTREQP
jgi:RNA polymerase sigma-70 factor (ECF subfamily)